MTTTKQDIEKAVTELKEALIQSLEADKKVEAAQLKKKAAAHRLLLAKDEIREIRFY